MQDAGWWVRSDITWGKPNAMPDSSAVYRPGSANERIILFVKSDSSDWFVDRGTGELRLNPDLSERRPLITKPDQTGPRWTRLGHYYDAAAVMQGRTSGEGAGGRFLRNYEPAPAQVWEIATKPFRESHFATFPPELVERCIRAGAQPGLPILDPFGGSGTTALVADLFGFDSTMIEINPEYVALARRRLASGLVKMDRPATPPAINTSGDFGQGALI